MRTLTGGASLRADEWTQQLICFGMPSRGGLVIGGLAGTFYGVQLLSSIARAKRDYKDTMAAGLATGMVFGIARAQRVMAPLILAYKACRHMPV